MGFENPLTGSGGVLVKAMIRSPDYVAGVSGWALKRDGSAEFSNATIRGSVDVIDASGSELKLETSGGFARMSLVPAPGIATYDVGRIYALQGTAQGAGEIDVQAPQPIAGGPYNAASMFVRSDDSAANGAAAGLLAPGTNGAISLTASGTNGQIALRAAVITSDDIKWNSSGSAETWHAVTLLLAGWTNFGGSNPSMQYRRVASPANCVQLAGLIKPGTKTDGTTIFTLPLGYRPNNQIIVPVVPDNTAASATPPNIAIQTNGNVNIGGCGTVNTFLSIHVIFPLDA